MHSSENEIKDRMLYDAIQTALEQHKVITLQKIAIAILTGCLVFVLAHKGV